MFRLITNVLWIFGSARKRTWPKGVIGRLIPDGPITILLLVMLRAIGGKTAMNDEVTVVAAALAAISTYETLRFLWNCGQLWRSTPGALRTLRIDVRDREISVHGWALSIDQERWRRTPHGWALAVHLIAQSHKGQPAIVPDFDLESGARTNDHATIRATAAMAKQLPPWPLHHVPDGARIDAWVLAPLGLRFSGGRPGYKIVASEIENWRGLTTRETVEPRVQETNETWLIEEELANLRSWGGTVEDTARAYVRAASGSGAFDSPARSQYQRWANRVDAYLRDRVGTAYHQRFSALSEDGDFVRRAVRKNELLDEFIKEFGSIARRSPDRP